jgi:hypothetical protein
MDKAALGRLEKLDLRSHWKNEAKDFTPWLAEPRNVQLLGDALALELEVESTEKSVGPFFADILCKDIGRDSWVLIENQIEPTDHTHLGQILTYAAGLEAKTIIWIAERFTSEHRAALDWLNEITLEDFNFFGVEIELWRIGDSAPAPKFNVVCQPNDWSRSVRASAARGELTEAKALQLEFWLAFEKHLKENSKLRCHRPAPQNWMSMSIGRSQCHLSAVASTYDSEAGRFGGELRMELVLSGEDAKAQFAQIESQKSSIESAIGVPLTWHNPTDKRMCRIYVRRVANIEDRPQWPAYHEWLREKLEVFHKVFAPLVKTLHG